MEHGREGDDYYYYYYYYYTEDGEEKGSKHVESGWHLGVTRSDSINYFRHCYAELES
jgi:hypothetical protein